MEKSAMYLVHKGSYMIFEWDLLNADDLREKADEYMKAASDLDKMDLTIAKLYADRCKKDFKELLSLMKEDKWLTSDEALEWGFVDEVEDTNAKPARLTASTASAMASAGIPVPENMPIDADGFFEKLEAFFGKLFKSQQPAANSQQPTPTNQQNTTIMTKVFSALAQVLGLEQAEFEAMEDGRFALEEAQMNALEQALTEKDAALAEKDTALAEKDTIIAEKEAVIAALQAKPEDAPEAIRAESEDDPADPHDAFVKAIANAREMYNALA